MEKSSVPIREDKFRLTQSDPVISTSPDTITGQWFDIWTYQVPNGTALILKPENTFSAYLYALAVAECVNTCKIKIEKRDSTGSDVLHVLGPALYLTVKEFQDVNLMASLAVPASGVVVSERELLVISVWAAVADVGLDVSESYFEMRISKIRKALAG